MPQQVTAGSQSPKKNSNEVASPPPILKPTTAKQTTPPKKVLNKDSPKATSKYEFSGFPGNSKYDQIDVTLYEELRKIKEEIALMKTTIQAQNVTIEQQKKEIQALQKKSPTSGQRTFASLFSGNTEEAKTDRHLLLNKIAAESNEREDKKRSVVVAGLQEGESAEADKEAVIRFFEVSGARNAQVIKVRRFGQSKRQITAHPEASAAASTNKVRLLQVILSDTAEQNRVLKYARHPKHDEEDFKGVYAREDRTQAEQEAFSALNSEKYKRNNELDALGLLDKPFRFVIHRRYQAIKAIKSDESREQGTSVFAKDKDVSNAIRAARSAQANSTA